ncbi:MAG TPA: 50S ribosomal protein L31e [Candidatus Nanoarchaeia archaeon]|nr:50S ribosomal protein L31e [Candidatus Nanoarchaeia archaeon]
MAKKQEDKKLERTYNVPLRKEFNKAPRWNRTPKAVRALRSFIAKHMKSEDVRIGKFANWELWKHGIKNPPHHIKVTAIRDQEGTVFVELAGAPAIHTDEPQKKRFSKKKLKEEKAAKKAPKIKKETGLEAEIEEHKEEKQEIAKEIQKEEIKELKDAKPKTHHPPKDPTIAKKFPKLVLAPQQK